MFALARSRRGDFAARAGAAKDETSRADDGSENTKSTQGSKAQGGGQLTPEQQQQVADLRKRDAEVRQHEASHQAAGGAHAGGASFTYQRGPDGKNYAIGGEVQVDVSSESTPAATISKMEQVKAAALAPAEPSPQDQRVASMADAIKAQAQQELRKSGQDGAGQDGAGQGGAVEEEKGREEGQGAQPTGGGESASPARSRQATGAYAAAAAIIGGGSSGAGGLLAISA